MATSYGSITIVDITDIGEFSVYPTANSPRTQIYNPDGVNPYTPDWSGSNPDTSLKITPVAYYASQNVSTAVTYTWQRRDGAGNITSLGANETVINFPDTNIPGILRVNANVLGDSTTGIISYIVTAHYTVDGVNLEAVGEIDFSLTRQGSIAKTAKIIGENIFKYDSTGALTPSGKTITLNGTVSGVSITNWEYKNSNSQSGWSTYPGSTSGSSTLVVSPTDNVFINNSVTIKMNTNNASVFDYFTITKLYDGTKGDSVISAVLSNESQMLPANESGHVTSYTGSSTVLSIFKGGSDITSGWVISKSYSPTSISTLDLSPHKYAADFSSTNTDNNTFNNIDIADVTFTCNKYILTEDTVVQNDKDYFRLVNQEYTKISPSGNENPYTSGWYEKEYDTITKKFSITKVKTGQPGATPIIYSLSANSVVVSTDPPSNNVHANPDPRYVTFNAYEQTGNNNPSSYAGTISLYINDSATATAPTSSSSGSCTIDFQSSPWNAATVSKVRAVLYESGGGANPRQLDTQTVVLVCDGAQGAPGSPGATGPGAVNVVLGNEADVIPCNSGNHPIPNGTGTDANKFIIDIPYEGYQGITIKTTSVNAPAIPTSDTGLSETIAPDTSEAGHIKYKIPNTATLVENGSINITFGVTVDGGNIVNVSKRYTWTRSSAAVNGINAVILQVGAEDGTVFSNSSGTLYAKANLYDGATEATDETYTWYQYKNGTYKIINSTNTPNVVTGHGTKNTTTGVWTWTNGTNGSSNTTSDMIKISAGAVEGYASFKVEATYNGVVYTQYISFIDKTDPIQVSLHSTVGTQIKNSQGVGCIYARVTRNGVELDTVPQNIQAGFNYPTTAAINDYFILLSNDDNKSQRTARLYKKTGSNTWVDINTISAEARKCQYTWYFRNMNNVPITTGVPYQDTVNRINNQFIYIDADLINSKIIIDCEVMVN